MKKLSALARDVVKKAMEPYEFEDGVKVSRYEDIKRIFRYKQDKFYDCTDDKAIFWQMSAQRVPHFKKNIIPSLKDFYPEGRGEYNQFQSYLTRIKTQKWSRESGFVYDLNDFCDDLTEFGEAVWKVLDKDDDRDVKTCDLRRIFFDRTVPFERADKVEIHELNRAEVLAKKDVWKNVENILEDEKEGKYKIYEFEGWHEDKKTHAFVYSDGDKEQILWQESLKDDESAYRYKKLNKHLIGIYQRLFVLQETVNRRVNQNDETQAIASLLIMASANPAVSGNVLEDAVSGQIVNDPTLRQVGIDNRALSGFLQEMMMYEAQADKLCMTPEVITGQELPSGTTFRGQAALTNRASSAFRAIRNQLAEFVGEVLIKDIFPHITRNWENQWLDIASDDNDFKQFDKAVIDVKIGQWALEMQKSQGRYPTWEELQTKRGEIQEALETDGRKVFINKGFFNWDFGFIYNHSNEVEDKAQQNDVYSNLIQLKMANPAIANDPLFRQWAEKNGINAIKLSQEEMQQLQPTQAPNIEPKQDKLMAQINE